MKTISAMLVLATAIACLLQTATPQTYGGGQFTFQGQIAARRLTATPPAQPDLPQTTGFTRFRTQGGSQLIFQSELSNAVDITAVQLHLSTPKGAVDNAPLVLALTNTSASVGRSPLSSSGNAPLIQTGEVGNAQLLANPQIAAARAAILALGITDNALQNIGDVDRLARGGFLYTDVHSLTRVAPNRVGSGIITTIPTGGRRRRNTFM